MQQHVDDKLNCSYRNPPPVLVLQYEREVFLESKKVYITCPVESQPMLNMKKALGATSDIYYRRIACVNREAQKIHYTADVLKNSQWFHCNDKEVSKISEPAAESASLLVFEKI